MNTLFITGATSGIGLVAACELASGGDYVLATARNADRGNDLLTHYKNNYPKGKGTIKIVICDLSSFESIVNACAKVKLEYTCIDTLINNAGVWNFSYRASQNNIEETLHVNVLAPLLLNYLLLDLLSKSKHAKSIFTASALHQGEVDFSRVENKEHFSGFNAYRQSKLEVILLCRILAIKFASSNIGVYCQHPGLVNTKLGRHANWFANLFFRVLGLPPEKGATTLIYLAQENKSKLVTGEYYYKRKVKKITKQSNDLNVAQRLLDTLQVYLKKYLVKKSILFKMQAT